MPKVYLGEVQHAKHKQDLLYAILESKKKKQHKTNDILAKSLDLGSGQSFSYRFNKQLLEAWELLVLFEELDVQAEDLNCLILER